jgi:uracil-DNA glycosylase family 4
MAKIVPMKKVFVESNELQVLASAISTCTNCNLCDIRLKTVPGSGAITSDIVIIGEAPGANEDQQGVPFIGRAGATLRRMLEQADISIGDCFITNTVKCWTGEGNPDPSPTQIEACKPWLDQQLEIIKPRGILTFGKYSTGKFIDYTAMWKLQGHLRRITWSDGSPCYIMPVYHPSWINRNPDEMEETVACLKKFKELVYGI